MGRRLTLTLFLSTLSLWRATKSIQRYFSYGFISIHALLVESDQRVCVGNAIERDISIHALLVESDSPRYFTESVSQYFYPRSPCGERPRHRVRHQQHGKFLSTLSLWRATYVGAHSAGFNIISIHALLVESDHWEYWVSGYGTAFLSTLSLWRATTGQDCNYKPPPFLSTLSLWRATCRILGPDAVCWHFYPRSPCGERLATWQSYHVRGNFYPRSPCGERPYIMTTIICIVLFLSTLSLWRATV